MQITYLLLLLPLLYSYTSADCGCGVRCMKYSSAKECTRCCTHSVRRSVPLFQDEQDIKVYGEHDQQQVKIYENKEKRIKVFDKELNEPVDEPSYVVIRRRTQNNENEQLSKLISNLYMKEVNYNSSKDRSKLRRRSKFQNYYRIRRTHKDKNYSTEISRLLELLLKETQSKERNSTKFRFSR